MVLPAESHNLKPISRITQLALTDFRNHAQFMMEPQAPLIAIVGANGLGKTNILEALSLFSPGKGLRNGSYRDMLRREGDVSTREWVVAAQLESTRGTEQIGTRFIDSGGAEKRVLRIEGEDIRGQATLTSHLSLVWLTPAMSHLFSEGDGARRRFFDRLVYGFDPEHAARVNAYEYHVRERNRILSEYAHPDTAWLETNEHKIAEYAVAIAGARNESMVHLTAALGDGESIFPVALPRLHGEAENLLTAGEKALSVEDRLRELLAASRTEDRRRGRTSVGTHRSRFEVWFPGKVEAADCSTGEQKALLFSIVLAYARARTNWQGTPPILLLDEVVAHLDAERRKALFAAIRETNAQAFLTGTDAADFEGEDGLEIRSIF